ncbi:HAMP domain-containing sensor histidine kinase [Niabella insulamsoli]|uniref:sensor histidine kinase n=1 Tax=Niabella insulamsoli TaxID=3144874 RepID=UPI0031FC6AD3
MDRPHPSRLLERFRIWLDSIINTGVTTDLNFEKLRRVRIMNLMAFIGTCISSLFIIVHLSAGRSTLGLLNILILVAVAGLLLANFKQKYFFGQIIVSVLLTAAFGIAGFLYADGMEFYLLLLAAVIATIMQKSIVLKGIAIADCLIFLWLMKRSSDLYHLAPDNIYFINMVLWLIFYVVFFLFWGKLSKTYLSSIEDKNAQLLLQQIKLTEQTEQVQTSNRQLSLLNGTQEKLFSIIAHDVRSPIAGLDASLTLLNKSELSREEFMDLSKDIASQLNQLQDSLDNLLKWGNRQMTGMELQKQITPIEPLITDTIGLLRYNLANKNINIDIGLENDLLIDADPDHVRLIMRNLISNAIKFSYAGGKIDLKARKEARFIHFSVIDQGMGMDTHTSNQLFDGATSVISKRGTQNEKGTGMGLKICREFAEKNGGNITMTCEPDLGCTAILTVPAAEA